MPPVVMSTPPISCKTPANLDYVRSMECPLRGQQASQALVINWKCAKISSNRVVLFAVTGISQHLLFSSFMGEILDSFLVLTVHGRTVRLGLRPGFTNPALAPMVSCPPVGAN